MDLRRTLLPALTGGRWTWLRNPVTYSGPCGMGNGISGKYSKNTTNGWTFGRTKFIALFIGPIYRTTLGGQTLNYVRKI